MIAYLYAIGNDTGPIKIGYSGCPERRIEQLRAKAIGEIRVLGTWAIEAGNAQAAERYAHWFLREKHYAREWFNVTLAEASEAIEIALTKKHDRYDLIPALDKPGRWVEFPEKAKVRFSEGTFKRVNATNGDDESFADFVRMAVECELLRREAQGVNRDGGAGVRLRGEK